MLPGLFPQKRFLCEKLCGQGGFLECTAYFSVPQGFERGEGKIGCTRGRKSGNLFLACPLRSRACQVVPFPLPVKTPYVYFLYLSKVTIILPVFLLVCPFFGNVVIFFISHFHFAQKTLSRKSLGTHSSLEESFTGLIDWKAAKLDSGKNCNELNGIIDTVTIPLPGSIIESCIKVLVPFQFVNKILKCDHPNESYWAAISYGIVYAAQGGSFKSVEEILKCDHNNESSTFLVLFLMLWKVVLTFESLDKILGRDHSF